jgi:hypothetical protein
MIDNDQRLKKRLQIYVSAAMTLFFVLVAVLAFTIVSRHNWNMQVQYHEQRKAELTRDIELARLDAAYFRSDRFARDYAQRYLSRGIDGRPDYQ